ncbi:MAG TPA: IPT/TIG domain-containing protein [Thermoanaerobaculia bacterium]|nr:IPT/TIG domain-containing protein [Thermoanaerobaculia bacterium]
MTHSARTRLFSATAFFLFCGAIVSWTACRGRETPEQAPAAAAEQPAMEQPAESLPVAGRAIARLHPATAAPGAVFNRQPNGNSALAVVGTGFTRGDRVHWGNEPLKTVYGGETTLTAEVPPTLISQPGDVTITVKDPADPQSREVQATFRLMGKGGP